MVMVRVAVTVRVRVTVRVTVRVRVMVMVRVTVRVMVMVRVRVTVRVINLKERDMKQIEIQQKLNENIQTSCSEGFSNTNFARSLRYGNQHDIHDSNTTNDPVPIASTIQQKVLVTWLLK